jgi:hypothetical protein
MQQAKSKTLMFWRQDPAVQQPAESISQELSFGEDVEGLVDLPVKDVIDRIKREFAGTNEKPGVLVGRGQAGEFEVSWTWQFFRIDSPQLDEDDRQKFLSIGRDFGCQAYEPKSTFKLT